MEFVSGSIIDRAERIEFGSAFALTQNADGTPKLELASTFGWSDPDVAHGMTDHIPNNEFAKIDIAHATNGGAKFIGASDDAGQAGLAFWGLIGVADPTDTTPAIILRGGKKSGTGATALGATETVLVIQNWTSADIATWLGNGNLGLGISPGSYKLFVNGNARAAQWAVDGGAYITGPGGDDIDLYADSTHSARFSGTTTAFNVTGINALVTRFGGVSAAHGWSTGYNAIELGTLNGIMYRNDTDMYFLSNAYYDGTSWRYSSSVAAGMYRLDNVNGPHTFYVAAAGVVGNPISWNTRLYIRDSGVLVSGTFLQLDATQQLRLDGSTGAWLDSESSSTVRIVGASLTNVRFGLAGIGGTTGIRFYRPVAMGSANPLYLDAGSNTYIAELVTGEIAFVAAGAQRLTVRGSGGGVQVVSTGNFSVRAGDAIILDGNTSAHTYFQEYANDRTAHIINSSYAWLAAADLTRFGHWTADPGMRFQVGTAYNGISPNATYNQHALGMITTMTRDNAADSYILNNAYYDSSNVWKRPVAGASNLLVLNNGSTVAFDFAYGASGAAGSTVSWGSIVQLYTSGRVEFAAANGVWHTLTGLNAFKSTYFGYSSGYQGIQIGSGSTNRGVFIQYDPIGNSSGTFSNGREVVIGHDIPIIFPNTANNNYYHGITFKNDTLRLGDNGGASSPDTPLMELIPSSYVLFNRTARFFNADSADGVPYNALFGSSTKRIMIGYDATNDYGVITSVHTGVSWKTLYLNPIGGAVLIGPTGLTVGGDTEITKSVSGSTLFLRLYNSSNTASSRARFQIRAAGSSAGAQIVSFLQTGVREWAIGQDTDSVFKIYSDDWGGGLTLSIAPGTLAATFAGSVTATDFILASDARLKHKFDKFNSRSILNSLEGWYFEFIDSRNGKGRRLGFKAQDVMRVLPEAVVEGPDGRLGVTYDSFIPVIVNDLNSAHRRIDALEFENRRLKEEMCQLREST